LKKGLIFVLFFVLIFGTASAYSKEYQVKKKVGEWEVEVRMDRNPPSLGDNNIEIEIKDGGGRTVTGAKVLVNYYMPPMPRMVPMNFVTDAKLKKEKYKATMNLIMSGPWIIAVKMTLSGKTFTVKFNVDAQ
jgi:hypothetical protein